MADRFEFKKDGPCLIAVMPDYVLPSGNVRVWTIDSHGMFFGDELTPGFAAGLPFAGEKEAERLKAELRKIGLLGTA